VGVSPEVLLYRGQTVTGSRVSILGGRVYSGASAGSATVGWATRKWAVELALLVGQPLVRLRHV
jgi:hypothetical protein